MSDSESDFYHTDDTAIASRSCSVIAQTEIIQSPRSNAYHLTKESILRDLAEKQFPLEDSELIFRPLGDAQDESHFAQSYQNGVAVHNVIPNTWMPTVAIVFLSGLDIISVDHAEQREMTNDKPKQRTARWRVLTAGTFLNTLEFDDSLTLLQTDCTHQVVDDMVRRKATTNVEDRGGLSLFRVAREDRVVTIDSDNVELVNNMSGGRRTDMQATLVEVDKSSLFGLVINFRRFIRDGGEALNTDIDTRVELLETMIEDARRLAIRSPILFRMSTRQQIARSKNTRYGVDHGSMFETITTSVGIKNIISRAAACFNSLATQGDEDNNKEQALVRPKFLQMLVLLLSLLNDGDLQNLAPLLKETYRINPERMHIELLVLKVLPLQSINKSIFVQEMVMAVQGGPPKFPGDVEKSWNKFVADILEEGYVLPGYTEQMGQLDSSWIVVFPRGEGYKDSYVFNNLQFRDEVCSINEIPPMDLGTRAENGKVTSILVNHKRYLINVADHRKITSMIFGEYSIAEATTQQRTCDLTISEAVVNDHLTQAIQKTNHLLGIVNKYFATIKVQRKLVKSMVRRLSDLNIVSENRRAYRYPDITSCGRLTWHEAKLNGQQLAVAYKVEGKKIARPDLIRNIVNDIRAVKTTLHYIELEIQRNEGRRVNEETRQTIAALRNGIPEIRKFVGYAEKNKLALENTNLDLGDEVVLQTIFPPSAAARGIAHWSPYTLRLAGARRHLRLEAYHRRVVKFTWRTDEVIEVSLANPASHSPASHREAAKTFFVCPLRRVKNDYRQWEIRTNDEVLLIGQYLVIFQKEEEDEYELSALPLEPERPQPASTAYRNHRQAGQRSVSDPVSTAPHPSRPAPVRAQPLIFQNWMKIVDVPKGATDPRLANRRVHDSMADFVVH